MYLDVILAENDAVAYTSCLQPHRKLISSLTVKPGGGGLLVSSPSVSQSVRLSIRCPSTPLSELFAVVI